MNLAPITEDEELAAANADDEVQRARLATRTMRTFLLFDRTTKIDEDTAMNKARMMATATMATTTTNSMKPYALAELVRVAEAPNEPAVVVAPTRNVSQRTKSTRLA